MRKLSRKLMNAMIRSKSSSNLSRSILVKNGQIIRPFWLLINSRAARLDKYRAARQGGVLYLLPAGFHQLQKEENRYVRCPL